MTNRERELDRFPYGREGSANYRGGLIRPKADRIYLLFCQEVSIFASVRAQVLRKTMPEISSFYGIIISMFFSDHNPPHFHVKYQGYEATIDIATGTVKGQLPRRALNMVYEWLDQHKDELMANWEKMERSQPFDKIKPLE